MPRRPFATLTSTLANTPDQHSPPAVPDAVQTTDHRIDRLGRSLATIPTRRTALRLGASAALVALTGWQFTGGTDAHNPLKNCKKLKQRSARKRCVKRAKAHNAKHKNKNKGKKRTPRKPNASCTVELNRVSDFMSSWRAAQTFTEPNGGKLTEAGLLFSRGTVVTGTFDLTINTVDAATGIPTNQILATSTVPASDVSADPTMVTFRFAIPVPVVAGRRYALVLSQTSETTAQHRIHGERPATCPGGAFYFSSSRTGPFVEPFENEATDLSYTTTVIP